MSNPSGSKGTKWETAVVVYMTGRGLFAKRKPKKGSKDQADIEVPALEDLLVIEAKNWKTAGLAAWLDETVTEAANAGVPVGACWHHRPGKGSPGSGYVTLQGDHFATLLDELIRMRARVAEVETALSVFRSHDGR